MTLWRRFARFNTVGALGVGVQLGLLALLTGVFAVGYLSATVLAVGGAIGHNFAWHAVWTWSDRHGTAPLTDRFARFVVANGVVSLAGNLVVMVALVGGLGVPVVPANVAAIGACGLVNFWLGDRFVFAQWRGRRSARRGEEEGLDELPQLGNRLGGVDRRPEVRAALEAFRVPGSEGAQLVDHPPLPALRRRR